MVIFFWAAQTNLGEAQLRSLPKMIPITLPPPPPAQLVSFLGQIERISSQPTTMAEAATAGATPLLPGLPDEIVIWEILVRLPPVCLLRCRAVRRSWRRVTSARDFLLEHHGRQPSLPIVCGVDPSDENYINILAFDHRAADPRLQPVARLDDEETLCPVASCDGLLVLSVCTSNVGLFSICNPATRQYAPLCPPPDFSLFTFLGMYLHRPTGEYRMLLHNGESNVGHLLPNKGKIGCYVFTIGSDQPPRYIGGLEAASKLRFDAPILIRDSLHWYSVKQQTESRLLFVFDTTAESFRQIRAPSATPKSYIFEMDGTLGIYSYNEAMQIVDIWVLQNYDAEVWEYKYRVELPVAEIRGEFGTREDRLDVSVVSVDGDVLLLLIPLKHDQQLFYVNTDGELVDSFVSDGQQFYAFQFRLKQTLISHNFFTRLEGYAVNASPFI